MQHFWDLEVWQQAHQLTLMVDKATGTYPREELFGLTRQTRDAVVSVQANIAEGHGRFGDREFHHYCNIAKGSLAETQNHLLIARDLGYLPNDAWAPIHEHANRVGRQLQSLMRRLRAD
jgi:four helix bundle protein